jgi:hypothetical protein
MEKIDRKDEKKIDNVLEKYKKEILGMFIVLILLLSLSFAWLTLTLNGTKNVVIKAGTLAVTLTDTSEGITLTNAVPLSDTDGLATTPYTFTIANTGNITSDYTIYLDDGTLETGETRMADGYVKYSLTKNSGTATTALLTTTGTNPNRVLNTGSITAGSTDSYTLRLWIDSAADNAVMNTTFRGVIRVEATQVEE